MYSAPSRRKQRKEVQRPNLIPILDAVFIFIFFLLMSANFIKIYEIQSDVPIINPGKPPKDDKPPLALTLRIAQDQIVVYSGVPSRVRQRISKTPENEYDFEGLRNYLISVKQQNLEERTIILEPIIDISYEEIVNIMDAVRLLRKTDPALFKKTEGGLEEKINVLFDNIVFGNIQS